MKKLMLYIIICGLVFLTLISFAVSYIYSIIWSFLILDIIGIYYFERKIMKENI